MEMLTLSSFDEKRGLFGVACEDGESWLKLPMRAFIKEIGEVTKYEYNSVRGLCYYKELA